MLVIARIATLFEIIPINEDMNDAMDFTAGLVALVHSVCQKYGFLQIYLGFPKVYCAA